jgi:predicted enzyme related to lactoylglutathione lyase
MNVRVILEERTMATGTISHIEFPADDIERAKRFYGAVAGWEFGEMPGMEGYWNFRTGPEAGGGLGKRGEMVGTVVRVYIDVDDLDAALAAATANGGTVVTPPTPIPGMGRFAAVNDPEGNEVGLFETAAT